MNTIRNYLMLIVSYALSLIRKDVDGILASLGKTLTQLDRFVAAEQAKRAASNDRTDKLLSGLNREYDIRAASRAASDRAQRVRDRIDNLLA